ncbi:MAG: DNA topoisomerase (ATP-hydrolyzing) subunit B [Candidatus Jorgensenbacteria bacterium]
MPEDKKIPSYTAKDIYVLEGLEPVRKRPGMYIGSTGVDGLHHLIWEVVDNSIDEAMAGYAKNIVVELLKENKVAVTDDGRGIPVDIHPKTKKSALETALCTLHAGGKFGGESYKVSGGLHGVGVSVVNALSVWVKAEVNKDGGAYVQEYQRGVPKYSVKKTGKSERTGTKITFQPDSQVFQKIEFDSKKVMDHLRQQAYLTKGVRIEFLDERGEAPFRYGFCFGGGLQSFIRYLVGNTKTIQDRPFYTHREVEGVDVEATFVYSDDVENEEMSFANNIYTPDGGMHLTGFRSALTRTLNDYARRENYLKESEENLTGDDVREGLIAAVSIKIREPQFEGQTKARLGNPEARTAVETAVAEGLKEFMERYGSDARVILEKNLLAAKARKAAKAAKDTVLRKGALEGLTLPGKLADCSSRKAEESELFIVEGDSAGGCFAGGTEVALADGRNLTFEELVKEDKQGRQNYCYTVSSSGRIAIGQIKNPRVTKRDAEVVKVTLDTGEGLVCTPDHRFMLRDGTYREAQRLAPRDSLMPLHRQLSRKGQRITIEGYEMVFDPADERWVFTHLLADQYNLARGIYAIDGGAHRHHLDWDKINNNPDNVRRMTREEHLEYHRAHADKTLRKPEVVEKLRVLRATPAFRARIRAVMNTPAMRKMLSARAVKQWGNPRYKEFMAKKFLEFYATNPAYREKSLARLNKAQRAHWSNSENRKHQAERTAAYFAKNPEAKTFLSSIAKKMWNDPKLLKWRSAETKKQWTEAFRAKRRTAYCKTYLQKALAVLNGIYAKTGRFDEGQYNVERKIRKDRSIIRLDTIRERFFDGDQKRLEEAVVNFNHKVRRVEKVAARIDVYDLEVPGTHNFALASGVFVHNSAKQGRDRRFQAILPLKGKILNVEKARIDKMLVNKEIRSLVIALGTAIADNFDLAKLRYGKVILMTDADVDGAHIRTLLLTLFYRYFPQIIEHGHLYIAQPPLFRLQRGKEVRYAWSDGERDKVTKALGGESVGIQRYKGLGEMNPTQLWETTLDPALRVLKQVMVADAVEADHLFDILMGEAVEPRKNFIQAHAGTVKNLDI